MSDVPSASAVLEKAGRRAADWLGLSDPLTTRLLGCVSGNPGVGIAPGSEEWSNALALIDVARRLERLCGSREAAHVWLRGSHLGFGRAPMKVLEGAQGPATIQAYLASFER